MGLGWRYTLDVPTGVLLTERAETEGDGPVHSLRGNYKGPQFGGTLSLNGLISTDEFKNEQHFFNATTDERFVNRSRQ